MSVNSQVRRRNVLISIVTSIAVVSIAVLGGAYRNHLKASDQLTCALVDYDFVLKHVEPLSKDQLQFTFSFGANSDSRLAMIDSIGLVLKRAEVEEPVQLEPWSRRLAVPDDMDRDHPIDVEAIARVSSFSEEGLSLQLRFADPAFLPKDAKAELYADVYYMMTGLCSTTSEPPLRSKSFTWSDVTRQLN